MKIMPVSPIAVADYLNNVSRETLKSKNQKKVKFKTYFKGGSLPLAPTKKLNKKTFNFLFSATPSAGNTPQRPVRFAGAGITFLVGATVLGRPRFAQSECPRPRSPVPELPNTPDYHTIQQGGVVRW
jgi:hypothetical protein